jgi:hypothetical protein
MHGNGSKLGSRGVRGAGVAVGGPVPGVAVVVALGVALAVLLGTVEGAGARALRSASGVKTVNVVKLLGAHLAHARSHDGDVAVLLPATLALQGPKFAAGIASAGRYQLELDYAEPCGGANVCVAAEFTGQRGSTKPYGKAAVKLADGITGAYSGIQCGASCSPAAIQWREHGVLYTVTATLGVELQPHPNPLAVRAAFLSAADQAITAGPR